MSRAEPRTLGDACLRNGQYFEELARRSESDKAFGHAYSLTVLAWEEFAKCLIYRMVEVGMMSLEKNAPPPTTLVVVDRHILTRHSEKHQLIATTLFGLEIIRALGGSIPTTAAEPPPDSLDALNNASIEQITQVLPEGMRPDDLPTLRERIQSTPSLVESIRALAGEWRSWNDARNRGFYVDDRPGGMVTPWDVTPEELNRLQTMFVGWRDPHRWVLKGFPAQAVGPLSRIFHALYDPSKMGQKTIYCRTCERERNRALGAATDSRRQGREVTDPRETV